MRKIEDNAVNSCHGRKIQVVAGTKQLKCFESFDQNSRCRQCQTTQGNPSRISCKFLLSPLPQRLFKAFILALLRPLNYFPNWLINASRLQILVRRRSSPKRIIRTLLHGDTRQMQVHNLDQGFVKPTHLVS